jgi:hypothetical protein
LGGEGNRPRVEDSCLRCCNAEGHRRSRGTRFPLALKGINQSDYLLILNT